MKTFRITSIYWLLAVLFSVCCSFAKAETSGNSSLVVKRMHNTDLYGVDAHGDSIWAVGVGGLVFYSPDSGKSWQLQGTGIINELFELDMPRLLAHPNQSAALWLSRIVRRAKNMASPVLIIQISLMYLTR